jgi:hypothetical protein
MKGDFLIEGVEPGQDYQLSVRPGADYLDYERAQLKIPASGLKFDIVLEPLGGRSRLSVITQASFWWKTSRKAVRYLKPIHIPCSKFRAFYYLTRE